MDSVDVTTFSEADGVRTRRIAVSADEPNMPSMGHTQAATDARCAECGAPMASDQRYCVECGERRGEPRFPAVIDDADTAPSPAAVTAGRRSRLSPNSTLIAFVGTLLLAMGVGVLIGRSGSSSPGRDAASGVQVVTVGGSGAAAAAPTGATGTTSSTAAAAAKPSSTKSSTPGASAAKAKAKLPPPTVKVGSTGTGKGYKNGHFTGEFFGSEE